MVIFGRFLIHFTTSWRRILWPCTLSNTVLAFIRGIALIAQTWVYTQTRSNKLHNTTSLCLLAFIFAWYTSSGFSSIFFLLAACSYIMIKYRVQTSPSHVEATLRLCRDLYTGALSLGNNLSSADIPILRQLCASVLASYCFYSLYVIICLYSNTYCQY